MPIFQIQIDWSNESSALAGQLLISITGESGEINNLVIRSNDAISVIEDNPIVLSFENESVGRLSALSITYKGLHLQDSFYLDAIQVASRTLNIHSYFSFDKTIHSGEQLATVLGSAANYGKFEIFKGKNKQFYFRLKAANGEIVAASEGYKSLQSAKKGIESIKSNALQSPVISML